MLNRPQDVQRGIMAAVVDIDELDIEFGDRLEDRDKPAMRLLNDRFFVEAGDDDGQERAAAVFAGHKR